MWLKASYTIEAAVVMPLVLGIIILLLSLSFFLHDNTVIRECAYTAAAKYADEQRLSNSDIKNKILSSNSAINERLISSKITYINAEVTNNKISFDIEARFDFPKLKIVSNLTDRNSELLRTSIEIKRVRPVKLIRNIRKIQSIIN